MTHRNGWQLYGVWADPIRANLACPNFGNSLSILHKSLCSPSSPDYKLKRKQGQLMTSRHEPLSVGTCLQAGIGSG